MRERLNEYRKKLCDELAYEIVLIFKFDETNFLSKFEENAIFDLLKNKNFVEKDLKKINRLIQNYNLIAPSIDPQFMPIRKDLELMRAKNNVLIDFPRSNFIVKTKKKLNDEKNRKTKQGNESNGILNTLLSRFR